MFHHVTKDKHQKNFFKKLYPGDQRVAQLSKDKVLTEVGGLLSLFPFMQIKRTYVPGS